MASVNIRSLSAVEAEARLEELGLILADAVADGASVNFLASFTREQGNLFWRAQLAGLATGEKHLLVAECGDRLLGTVMLILAPQPNGSHRAEIGKMLVLSSARRRGVGRKLLEAAEAAALSAGRTLLLLDTETGSAGEALYRRCGWIEWGRVPGHAYRPEGILADTTFFYKRLRA
ncbi:GNAT superfamily N-acetyltransferase [Rhodoligotrophos appendicifer]|uniref:GNAT family N-acetyltransferase n=1 Tax=Rhodoligotrophos appendicifer TaxID=987056 RepID=UPI00117DCF13|nr:GNAT family N-acetyltransferase [Rhodoligotrophos appendicifer]